jgi:molecular chaperone DnaJ
MQIQNLYAILGLDSTATMNEIKKAYRRLAKELHPDNNKAPEAEEKFKDLKEAFDVIGDEQKRQEYDDFVEHGSTGRSYGPSFESVFNTFFTRPKTAATPIDGTDIAVTCKFFVHDVITSARAQKTVKFIRKSICVDCNGQAIKAGADNACSECGGAGSVPRITPTPMGSITTSVTCTECKGLGRGKPMPCSRCAQTGSLPEDVETTFVLPPYTVLSSYVGGAIYTICLFELGNAGREGGKNGNLIIKLEHDKTDRFQIQRGFDVVTIHTISLREAITGGKASLRLPNGDEAEFPIRAGASEGERVSFPGHGLYDQVAGKHGDCYIELHVVMPYNLSAKDLTKITTILKSYE